MANHVVQFSGGVGSWMAARRVIQDHDPESVVLLFADVKMEDEDLYRFLDDVEADLGIPVTRIAEGRDPWQVFHDVRFLGNTRIDPCSRQLKRDFLREWIEERYDPADTVIYLGIDWSEEHRLERAKPRWAPYEVRAPLCEPPYFDKDEMLLLLQDRGIKPPRLYDLGFPHNNCGGFCIKAGQAHFKLLLEKLPERFEYHARREQELREALGKDVAILRERRRWVILRRLGLAEDDIEVRDGKPYIKASGQRLPTTLPKTLVQLRQEVERGDDETDPYDFGGCGCVV